MFMFSFPQALSCRMEHVLLSLSVHVFTMEHHMYKDMYFDRAAAFGECDTVFTISV